MSYLVSGFQINSFCPRSYARGKCHPDFKFSFALVTESYVSREYDEQGEDAESIPVDIHFSEEQLVDLRNKIDEAIALRRKYETDLYGF